jgi:hypothetical protein
LMPAGVTREWVSQNAGAVAGAGFNWPSSSFAGRFSRGRSRQMLKNWAMVIGGGLLGTAIGWAVVACATPSGVKVDEELAGYELVLDNAIDTSQSQFLFCGLSVRTKKIACARLIEGLELYQNHFGLDGGEL